MASFSNDELDNFFTNNNFEIKSDAIVRGDIKNGTY